MVENLNIHPNTSNNIQMVRNILLLLPKNEFFTNFTNQNIYVKFLDIPKNIEFRMKMDVFDRLFIHFHSFPLGKRMKIFTYILYRNS